nr:IS1182 family transposase [Anaerosolibacter sp.]
MMNINEFQLILPINTGIMIPENDSVRLLNKVVEQLDFKHLYDCYASIGRPPAPPKMLFKVVSYAYMNGIYSSRKIETACRRDINFIWLLGGEEAPDHNTISRFRSGRLAHVIEELFYQLVTLLGDMGEIAYENIFIDGTKIEANANKYSFVWKKSIQKHELRLQEKIQILIEEINRAYGCSYIINEEKASACLLVEILDFLEHQKSVLGIEFVHGKGKRKTPLQRHIEKLKEYINTKEKYDSYNQIFDGRNSFSKTDHDATFMHMKEDHMRNSQLKPGYNVQIGVEGEYVVGMDIFSERSDQLTFIPFIEKLHEKLPKYHQNAVTDGGYESEENYAFLETHKQKAFIKPTTYEMIKKSNFKKKIDRRENMTYDAEKDEYTCHNQRQLRYIGDKKRRSKSGYESKIKIYECENCEDCEHKQQCTKAKGNKQLQVAIDFIRLREISLGNITGEEGIKLRVNRSIQVEGAFGILKEDYGFRRFLLRGKQNVKTEFMLLCFGFNINKLHSKILKNRCGVSLFNVKVA